MIKNINEMNYYELAKEVHANAVAKGFWDEERSTMAYAFSTVWLSVSVSTSTVTFS